MENESEKFWNDICILGEPNATDVSPLYNFLYKQTENWALGHDEPIEEIEW